MRSRLILSLITCLLGLIWSQLARAEIAVIVHPENPIKTLTTKQVSDLYLGRNRHFYTDAEKYSMAATIYEHPANSSLREKFFRALNGMSVSQLNAYWARLRFSGEVLPPEAVADSRSVLDAVKCNRNAIGYVDASAVDGSVKIVLRIDAKD